MREKMWATNTSCCRLWDLVHHIVLDQGKKRVNYMPNLGQCVHTAGILPMLQDLFKTVSGEPKTTEN